MKLGLELVRAHVDFSAPFCLPYPRVASRRPPHETSVLVCRDTERSLADAPHLGAHRLHRVPNDSRAPESPSKRRARASYTRVASAARSRATSSSARSRRSTSARWTPRSSPSSTRWAFVFSTSCNLALAFLRLMFVCLFLPLSSLWTNRTGTFIIGLQANGRRLSAGWARKCSRS